MSVTDTVAEWLTVLAVPVIVRFPVSGGLELEQPAKTTRITTAIANPSRTRSPLAFGSRKSNSNARIRGTICGIEIGEYALAVAAQAERCSSSLASLAPFVRSFRQQL